MKTYFIRRISTIFLQIIIVLIGIAVLAALLWEPWLEGRNAHATTAFEVYFNDPFLALVYAGSVAFFIALYQAFRLLGYIRHDMVFSVAAIKALRMIKYCAMVIIGFVVVEEIFIILNSGSDDRAGGVFMGILIMLGSVIAAAAATVCERILQKAVEIKSENDLTV